MTPTDWLKWQQEQANMVDAKGRPLAVRSVAPTEMDFAEAINYAQIAKQAPQMDAGKTNVQMPPTSKDVPPHPTLSRMQAASVGISPEDRALRADLAQKFKQLVVQSEQDLAQNQRQIENVQQMSPGLNFAPMAALADKWSGGGNQLSQAAASLAQFTPEDKEKLLMQLQGQKTANQEKLANIVGSRMGVIDNQKMALALAQEQNKNARFLSGHDARLGLQYVGQLNKDIKMYQDALPATMVVDHALTPDKDGRVTVQAVRDSLSNAAKLLGEKGVLTDTDIARIWQSSFEADIGRFMDKFGGKHATIPADQVAVLRQMIATGRQSLEQAALKKAAMTRESYKGIGFDPAVAHDIEGRVVGEFVGNKQKPNAGGPPKDTLSADDAKKMFDKVMGRG